MLARLSADWQSRYGHRVLVVETFVDPAQFCGTFTQQARWCSKPRAGRHSRAQQKPAGNPHPAKRPHQRRASRLRAANALPVRGLFARLADSLFMHWRSHQPKAQHKTTTDFDATISAAQARRALRTVTARQPNLTAA